MQRNIYTLIAKRLLVPYIYIRDHQALKEIMDWQRARTDEKKTIRKDAIYAAALSLFKRDGYEKVSLNGIAAEAGFTKSNLYRYFSSKDEIFLNIFSDLFEGWVDDCLKRLRKLEQDVSIKQFAKTWIASLKPHPQYLDLTPLLFTALERNSSFEQLIAFKTVARDRLYEVAVEICRIYPYLIVPDAFKYLSISFAATINYWTGSTENDALKKIYGMAEYEAMRLDFDKDLTTAIEITLRGLGIMQ